MTVREFMAVLATVDPEATVCIEFENFVSGTDEVSVVQAQYGDGDQFVFLTTHVSELDEVAKEWGWIQHAVLHNGDAS